MKLSVPPVVKKRWPLLLGAAAVGVAAFMYWRSRQEAAAATDEQPIYASYIPAQGFINPGGIEPAWMPTPPQSLDDYQPPVVNVPNPAPDVEAETAFVAAVTTNPAKPTGSYDTGGYTPASLHAPEIKTQAAPVSQQPVSMVAAVSERYNNYFLLESRMLH